MISVSEGLFSDITTVWTSGGWLMLPLFLLAIFIYYNAIDLLLRVRGNFLLKRKVYQFADTQLASEIQAAQSVYRPFFLKNTQSVVEIKRHFQEVRNEYLRIVNRRLRFLAILATTSPLVGLLGTVTGMLATFSGMVETQGTKFENVVEGISEALITTQTGLMISIPALVVISLIIQNRNRLERCIARLEYANIKYTQTLNKAV